MNIVNESWENTIDVMLSLLGDDYVTRRLFISDCGRGTMMYNNREWTSDNGKLVILGRSEDLSFLPNDVLYELSEIRKLLHTLYINNSSFVIGNNFFYPDSIELYFDNRICIPTNLNNIIYYGNKKDKLGIVSKVMYNYVFSNNFEVNREDVEDINKKVLKKIC